MDQLLSQAMEGMGGVIDKGEMVLSGERKVFDVPSGTYAKWEAAK